MRDVHRTVEDKREEIAEDQKWYDFNTDADSVGHTDDEEKSDAHDLP